MINIQIKALQKTLGIDRPIIQGGMGNISPPSLCVAVSEAGGLGQVGVGNLPLKEVEQKIKKVVNHLQGKRPFGVNVPLAVHPQVEEVIQLIIDHRVPVVSLSAGNPAPWMPILKQHGIKVMVVVATVRQAKKAEEAGADVVVGEGFEAAGKNSPKELTTLTLIPQLQMNLNIPVIAAGGIADGRGLLAAFALGASGAQLGTRLIATKEAQVHEAYQQALIQAVDEDTFILGRKYGLVTRVLKTPYSEQVMKTEEQGINLKEWMQQLDEESHYRGAMLGKLDQGHINAGQISGAIQHIPTVQELLAQMMAEAKNIHAQIGMEIQ